MARLIEPGSIPGAVYTMGRVGGGGKRREGKDQEGRELRLGLPSLCYRVGRWIEAPTPNLRGAPTHPPQLQCRLGKPQPELPPAPPHPAPPMVQTALDLGGWGQG